VCTVFAGACGCCCANMFICRAHSCNTPASTVHPYIHTQTGAARRRSVASSAYLTSSDEDLSDDDTAHSNSKGNSSSGHHSRSKTATGGAATGVRGLSGSSSGNRRGSTGGSSSKSTSRYVLQCTATVYMLCHTTGIHYYRCVQLLLLHQLFLQCSRLRMQRKRSRRTSSLLVLLL
jgi:hypothetical protein